MRNSESFECLNCGKEIVFPTSPVLYCSIACSQEAELVRYVRRCTLDGRIEKEDVQEAIQIRLAHIMSGGYNKKERHISPDLRERVFELYGWKCNICGAPGIDIDHISGPENEIDNFQLLCRECHNRKTLENVVIVEEGCEKYDQIKKRYSQFWKRVEAGTPLKICDDGENWKSKWRSIVAKRREILNQKTTSNKKL